MIGLVRAPSACAVFVSGTPEESRGGPCLSFVSAFIQQLNGNILDLPMVQLRLVMRLGQMRRVRVSRLFISALFGLYLDGASVHAGLIRRFGSITFTVKAASAAIRTYMMSSQY